MRRTIFFTHLRRALWLLVLVFLAGCSGSDSSSSSTEWFLNESNETAAVITNADGSSILVNVQSVTNTTISSTSYVEITATGIPNYEHTMSADDIIWLNTRTDPASDFKSGSATTATEGVTYAWGDDINFNNAASNPCYSAAQNHGDGWWPPGPTCPTDQARTAYFPSSPSQSMVDCYTRANEIGLYLNGVSIYNWTDDTSYNSQGVWHNIAMKFEERDVDICLGHANADGDYHQHGTVPCLEDQMGDTGTAHSPLYGYAADGYPIYGKWYASGVKATPRWVARDYTSGSGTGCAVTGERTCVMNDRFDINSGVTAASSAGPTTSQTVTSQSGNDFTVVSGFYFEDWVYDSSLTASDDRYLDKHNGHDHDSLGYHYHVTETFPYNIGPTYYGVLDSNTLAFCSGTPY